MAKKIISGFYVLLFIAIVFSIFKNWFINPEIIGGDWPYYQTEALKDYSLLPHLWAPWLGNGTGGVNPLLGLYFFQAFLIVVFNQFIHIPWPLVYKIGWFGLYIFLSIFSTIYLLKTVFKNERLSTVAILIGGVIYISNTYALMLVSGGQMGVALSYALAPLVLAKCVIALETKKIPAAALLLGLQIMIDARISYVVLVAVLLYFLTHFKKQTAFANIVILAIIGVVALFLNAFWLLPLIVLRANPLQSLGGIYTSVDALHFFSFADFSHAFSLLQSNWPENLFGKTYFLRPEFLIIPLVAFSSLLFKKAKALFFSLMGIIGVFLAKGTHEPLGSLYAWFFVHLPGFIMFRDSSKFYVLGALSFCTLIPYALDKYRFVGKKFIHLLFLAIWIFTIRQAVSGQLTGTFTKREVPSEYIQLKNLLVAQPEYYRELWIPRFQRFGFASNDRMGIEAEPLFQATNAAELVASLRRSDAKQILERRSIRYIILPTDPLGDIFLSDRKYDDTLRNSYASILKEVPWLTKKQNIGGIEIYETPSHRDHFWLEPEAKISYSRIDQSSYKVALHTDVPSTLFFSETYHPGWELRDKSLTIHAQKTNDSLNSFTMPIPGDHEFLVVFAPQMYVDYGLIISGTTLIALVFFPFRSKFVTIRHI